jgi:hypothetical protein
MSAELRNSRTRYVTAVFSACTSRALAATQSASNVEMNATT